MLFGLVGNGGKKILMLTIEWRRNLRFEVTKVSALEPKWTGSNFNELMSSMVVR